MPSESDCRLLNPVKKQRVQKKATNRVTEKVCSISHQVSNEKHKIRIQMPAKREKNISKLTSHFFDQ